MTAEANAAAPPAAGSLSPTDALRTLRALHSDPKIESAQRSAITWIILCADNKTGLAWASYENIRKNTGLAPATIREALRRAEGKYLNRAGLGRKGAIQWRVALQPLKCRRDAEPPPALQPLKCTTTIEVQPALQPLAPCTSTIEDILTLSSSPKKKGRGKGAAPSSRRRKPKTPAKDYTSADILPLLPASLNTPPFLKAWDQWHESRAKTKKPLSKMTDAGVALLLKKLDGWGPDVAVKGIENSVMHGWQGIFLPKDGAGAGAADPPPAEKPHNTAEIVGKARWETEPETKP